MAHKEPIISLVALFALLSLSPVFAAGDRQESKPAPKQENSKRAGVSLLGGRIRFGGVSVGVGYRRLPGFFPYFQAYPFSFYQPWYYGPYYPYFAGMYSPALYHPGWFSGFSYSGGMGEVKIRSNLLDADVFLDSGFAGKVKDLKTIWLDPGVYNLKIQADNHRPFEMRIYVLSGKTIKINAQLTPH